MKNEILKTEELNGRFGGAPAEHGWWEAPSIVKLSIIQNTSVGLLHKRRRPMCGRERMWALSRWQLKQFPTLYRDTRDFIQNISYLKALLEDYFVRLDIEEFF